MGWFWGSSDENTGDKAKDPLRNLDPSLREFLSKESPLKYSSCNPPAAQEASSAPFPSSPDGKSTASTSTTSPADDTAVKTPSQSQFKDGRYAHLWRTYQPQAEAEAEGKTDQEKIQDVLQAYQYRKAEIGRAALENCALEQQQITDCYKNGSWGSKMTVCRAENRKFERCYLMQQKFLKALGYLSTLDRPPAVDEKIQMHADTLFHRMLEQEKAIEIAKAEGKPVPTFPSLLSSKSMAPSSPEAQIAQRTLDEGKVQMEDLDQSVQAGLKKRLEKLSDEERDLEQRAIKAEIRVGEQVAGQLGTLYETQAAERKKRREAGKETITDRLSSMFGYR